MTVPSSHAQTQAALQPQRVINPQQIRENVERCFEALKSQLLERPDEDLEGYDADLEKQIQTVEEIIKRSGLDEDYNFFVLLANIQEGGRTGDLFPDLLEELESLDKQHNFRELHKASTLFETLNEAGLTEDFQPEASGRLTQASAESLAAFSRKASTTIAELNRGNFGMRIPTLAPPASSFWALQVL